MAESKSIDQWQELVKSCNESGKSKAAFCRANSLNYHQFLYWCTKFNKKTHPLIPVRITNANEPLAFIRLGNGSMLAVMSREVLSYIIGSLIVSVGV